MRMMWDLLPTPAVELERPITDIWTSTSVKVPNLGLVRVESVMTSSRVGPSIDQSLWCVKAVDAWGLLVADKLSSPYAALVSSDIKVPSRDASGQRWHAAEGFAQGAVPSRAARRVPGRERLSAARPAWRRWWRGRACWSCKQQGRPTRCDHCDPRAQDEEHAASLCV